METSREAKVVAEADMVAPEVSNPVDSLVAPEVSRASSSRLA